MSNNIDIFDFECTSPGENSNATAKTNKGLPLNHSVTINGHLDLADIIRFNDDGRVYGIRLEGTPDYFDYILHIDARGPRGVGSGRGCLSFTDTTGDIYKLRIYSSKRSTHTIRYDSTNPNIVKIEWKN